jgi:ribonuclease HII
MMAPHQHTPIKKRKNAAKATFEFELPYWEQNAHVIGIDEVGRGCLAGPASVGAVCFHPEKAEEIATQGIHDSKKLTKKKRELLSPYIQEQALCFAITHSPVSTINRYGIVRAIEDAAVAAVQQLITTLPPQATIYVFTDTLRFKKLDSLPSIQQIPIPKGDTRSISIAGASILAKVARDAHMAQLALAYPQYGWESNVGYATSDHQNAILTHNICLEHRTLFVRNILHRRSLTL